MEKESRITYPARPCALCLRLKTLQQSHIVPAFAVRYLKRTSATGYLRGAIEPHLRRQDLDTLPLLCHDCEELVSASERQFSLSAFPLIQGDDFRELEYGPWLLKFAVSLNWRALVAARDDVLRDFPQFARVLEKTLEQWRLFLIGNHSTPGTEHHLFVFAGVPESVSVGFHPKLLHYALRAIDVTQAVGKRHLAGYAKMMRSIFYSPIIPSAANGWKRTRIHAGGGRLASPQEIKMPGFGEFINSRIAEAFTQPLSEKQAKKIQEAMLKNPDRAIASESYKVHRASRAIFGKDEI
jgi:hypothetical protein